MKNQISTNRAWNPLLKANTRGPEIQNNSPIPIPTPTKDYRTTSIYDANSQALKGSTAPQADPRLPHFLTAAALATKQMSTTVDSAVIEIWEGTVLSVDTAASTMEVRLNAKTSNIPAHTGEIELKWVMEQDLELLRPGAVFYLTLYKQITHGSIHNVQEIRFRRRPTWSKRELEQIGHDAEMLASKIKVRSSA